MFSSTFKVIVIFLFILFMLLYVTMFQEARSEDIVKSKRHFETWGGFWGRPGHGAPKGNNYKENLDSLLYRIPVATV